VVDEAGILVGEAVVVLAPDVGSEQVVEGGHRPAPGDLLAYVQPLSVLVEHRRDDVDEGLVAGEKGVPPGQQVALDPALDGLLAQDLHHPARRGKAVIPGKDDGIPGAGRHLQYRIKPVRPGLVGPEDAEVLSFQVQAHHFGEESAHHLGGFRGHTPRRPHVHREPAKIGQLQVAQEKSPVGMRVGAQAPATLRRQFGQFGP